MEMSCYVTSREFCKVEGIEKQKMQKGHCAWAAKRQSFFDCCSRVAAFGRPLRDEEAEQLQAFAFFVIFALFVSLPY
jgi:hypothetical protein